LRNQQNQYTGVVPEDVVPAPVALVRDFVNTIDHETGVDELSTQAELVRHLEGQALLRSNARATAGDLALAHRLRTGLRLALEANHDGDALALPELAAALSELPVALTWTEDGPALRATAGGVRGALAQIGLAANEAATMGDWSRLKICSDDECQWAYYDHSKNRSRSWCEYGCGNKAKTRAYRARQRAAAR
jgi:predicted RNA-binding Zn ribbon-like protein